MTMYSTIRGFQAEVGLVVYPQEGHILIERMLSAQGGVGFMSWFREQPQSEYEDKTPEQLLREGRTSAILDICSKIEKAKRNGDGEY